MANNDELIYKGKALKDLRAIKDMLVAAGDPFLASVMNRAIECIENQPAAEVRCIECKYLHNQADGFNCTNHKGLAKINIHTFCPYGEKHESNGR